MKLMKTGKYKRRKKEGNIVFGQVETLKARETF
jgi:hypothetical protein